MPALARLAALGGFLAALPASAAPTAPQQIGQDGSWTAYTVNEGGRQVCYVLSDPTKSEPEAERKAYLMVTHRPAEKVYDVVSIHLGEDLPANGSAAVTAGKEKFDFFTRRETAWSRDSDTDKAVVTAMIKAKILTIKVKPAKGTALEDTYSLTGFKHAMEAIDKACKVRR